MFKPEPSPAILFKDLAEDYLGIIVAERSVASKMQIIRDVLMPEFGERCLSEITYHDLELWKKRRELVPTYRSTTRTVARIGYASYAQQGRGVGAVGV